MTQDQEQLINKLVYYQQEFESPSEEDIKKITPFPLGDSEEDNERRFQHITEITILTVQLIVEFSKRVPGFDTLLREDQITLLKVSTKNRGYLTQSVPGPLVRQSALTLELSYVPLIENRTLDQNIFNYEH